MFKEILKRFIPATFYKIESSNNKLLSAVRNEIKKIEKSIGSLHENNKKIQENISLLEDNDSKINQQIISIAERHMQIEKKLMHINSSLEMLEKDAKFFKDSSQVNADRYGKLYYHINEIQQKTNDNFSVCNEIKRSLSKTHHMYNNNFERKVISSFYEMYEQPDFKEKFLKLIDGLDECDIELIVQILQRQQLIRNTLDKELDLFSLEEQQQILKIKKELEKQIFKISDDMFCFKHYLLPVNHFEASVFCYHHGIECIENLDAIKEKDILDVGGFIGDSILVLKPLTNRRIISFEAVTKNYELMKSTVEMNHLDNVILEKMALGSKKCTIDIEIAGSCSAVSANDAVKVEGIESVPMNTLDSYVEGSDINVGLIKVDIEGAEQDFLKGARKTIETFKPVLLLSIYHNADDFFNIKPMIENWNLGYKFRIHKPADYSVSREVLLIAEIR